jgi:hypothetical protein
MTRDPGALRYHEIRFWSVVLGCDAARIYIFDARGGEHFAVVPMKGGSRHSRWVRGRALEAIAEHIRSGEDAGEVSVDLTAREVAA